MKKRTSNSRRVVQKSVQALPEWWEDVEAHARAQGLSRNAYIQSACHARRIRDAEIEAAMQWADSQAVSNEENWFYADDIHAERWDGPHNTRVDAIEYAQKHDHRSAWWVAPGHHESILDYVMSADEIMDDAEERARDGLSAEIDNRSDEAQTELQALLDTWAAKWRNAYVHQVWQVDTDKAEHVEPTEQADSQEGKAAVALETFVEGHQDLLRELAKR